MKDWYTLEPDRVRLLQKHFSKGRGGRKIRHVTRHHMGGIGGVDECWNWWQTRAASAHYAVSPMGEIGQLVWDRDTAWANANTIANQETIAIEHSNSGGAASGWPINDVTLREGARLAAAVCYVYELGRPVFGKNIRDHREFGQTSCPHHLANGGKYHATWMRYATEHYDWMVANAAGKNAGGGGEELDMSAVEDLKKYLDARVTGPIGSDVKDIRQQLTGGRDKGEYPGYPQIDDRTIVDALAVIGARLEIPGFVDPHGGSLKAKKAKGGK